MKKVNVYIIKAFTKNKKQGNPAGVILNADDLSDQQMQNIAQKIGFSECVFLQKSDKADIKTKFFSPQQEMNLCGHATIAAFHIFNKEKIYLTQETNIGILSIIRKPDGLIEMKQNKPIFTEYVVCIEEIADLLHIKSEYIMENPQIISTGTPKLIIPIKSLDILFSIIPNLKGIEEYCIKSEARGFYPFTHKTLLKNSHFHARQFNPLAGINEDPITGIAAGALGVYIKKNYPQKRNKFIIEQGYILNKFGKIYVDIDNDDIYIGGYAVLDRKIEITISPSN